MKTFAAIMLLGFLIACTPAPRSGDPVAERLSPTLKSKRLFNDDVARFQATGPAPRRQEDSPGRISTGFSIFKFGESRDRLGALAIEYYGLRRHPRVWMMVPTKNLPADSAIGFRDDHDDPTLFHIDSFPIADRRFQVDLLFDSQGRFYRVEFHEMGSWGARGFDTMTWEREGFLGEMLTAKFGPATSGSIPRFLAIAPGANLARIWKLNGATAGTEVVNPSTYAYFVRGFIEDDALAASKVNRFINDRHERAVRGAKDF